VMIGMIIGESRNIASVKGLVVTVVRLLVQVRQLGYGSWDELKAQVRQSWRFRFDWFFKSRTPQVTSPPVPPPLQSAHLQTRQATHST